MKNSKEKKYYIILIIILAVGIITRIIGFGQIPKGINVDEAGTMYDAYCIANYGTDRFENAFPVYMINYGGGQSALYTYLAAIFIKIFGFNLTAVRLPALIFSIIYMIFAFLLTKDFKNKKVAILVEFLIAIVPWHFMQSRWALDCNLMSAMMLISIYALIKAKRKAGFILAGILFGITLYSYALSYIVIPIFLIVLLAYMIYAKKIKISQIICLFIPIVILAIPLILNLLVNAGIIPEIKLSWISILKMWEFRSNEITISNIGTNLIEFVKSMFAFDRNNYNAFPQFGTLYYISIPFAVIGLWQSIQSLRKDFKEKKISADLIMAIIFISVFILGLFIEPGINRINAIYISLIYYTALGIAYIIQRKKYVGIIIISAYTLVFIVFLWYYFNIYPKDERNRAFNSTTIEVVKYIESEEKFDNKYISMRTDAVQSYIYTLIANETPPDEFNEDAVIDKNVFHYGRYLFYYDIINNNVIYVLEYDEPLKDELLENGFTAEKFNDDITIYYKE